MDIHAQWTSFLEKLRASGSTYDEKLITKAYQIAEKAHTGQLRKSGDPYISHPLAVAEILLDIGMDSECIIAAILHDVVEDTSLTNEDMVKNFGETIAQLVDGVTKIGKIPFSTDELQQAENVRKMLMAMSKDIRVIIIKLADRLHNMRTLMFMKPQKQRDKAKETMEVYAPIAHRLGMRSVKEELEDLSLRYLDPMAYDEIVKTLEARSLDNQDYLQKICNDIRERVHHLCDDMVISSRVKSIYGIYRKMYMQNRSFEEIYDIYAVRIIVDTVEECYAALGIIHDMYHLIPNRFKDYISTPKQNGYRSLHTTVIGREGLPFEVQIRTFEMHKTAEFGIAAHWKYKVGVKGQDKLDERLAWINKIINSQQDAQDKEELLSAIKVDLSPEDIFALTPKGDVINLPQGSTVIDFAYAIHTAVGNRMIGAKVDGRIVPLDYKIRTGQIVEILTTKSSSHGPSRDWLKIVRTNEARGKIRSWFKKERREENIEQGRADFEWEIRRAGLIPGEEIVQQLLKPVLQRNNCNTAEDLYAAIGYGGVQLTKIINQIKEDYTKLQRQHQSDGSVPITQERRKHKSDSGVVVEGLDNCLVKFAKCCNPLPGEPIIGFVTRGYGVSIHRADCTNAVRGQQDPEQEGRWVRAYWAEEIQPSTDYKVTLEIRAENRPALLADITIQLSNMRIPIHAVTAREDKDGIAVTHLTISITSKEHMMSIISKLKKVDSVLSVERSGA